MSTGQSTTAPADHRGTRFGPGARIRRWSPIRPCYMRGTARGTAVISVYNGGSVWFGPRHAAAIEQQTDQQSGDDEGGGHAQVERLMDHRDGRSVVARRRHVV